MVKVLRLRSVGVGGTVLRPSRSHVCNFVTPCNRSFIAPAAVTLGASGLASARRASAPRSAIDDVSRADAASLARAIRRSVEEGDMTTPRWEAYAARAAELCEELSLTEAARLASGFSTARVVQFDLFSRLSTRALQQLRQDPQDGSVVASDLRRLAISFGRARVFDTELMEALVPRIVDRVEDFRPGELARIADAYARMPVQSPDLFALIADALPPYLYDLEPTELVSLCRAFSEAAVYSQELTDAICEEVVKRLRSFGAMECVVFLEGLAGLRSGLPDELQRDDREVIVKVAKQVGPLLGSLAATDLVRLFGSLVRLNFYDSVLVHQRLCPALAMKLGQLDGLGHFPDLAELLHCLGLLPAQSHKTAELALATAVALRRLVVGAKGLRVEPRAVAVATAALAELGQQEEELLEALAAFVVLPPSAANSSERPRFVLPIASDEELMDLHRAFSAHLGTALGSRIAASALEAIDAELSARAASDAK